MPRMARLALLFLLLLPAPAALADWSVPVTLGERIPGMPRYSPVVAANPNGDAVALWTHWYDQYTTSVETSWRTGDGAWTPWTTLSGEIEFLAGGGGSNPTIQPTVAINDAGEAAAAWTKGNRGSGYDFYVAIKPPGRPFKTPVMLSGSELKTVFYPSVGVDAAGDVFALWEDMDDKSIYFAEAPRGGSFGPPHTISPPDPADLAMYPSMAVSANGDAAISWSDRHHSYLQIRTADGMFQPAVDLVKPEDCYVPHAAVVHADAQGDFIASWAPDTGYECRGRPIRYRWRAAGEPTFGATRELQVPIGYVGGAGGLGLSRDGHATWVFQWDKPDFSSPLAAEDAPLLGDFGAPVLMGPETGSSAQLVFDASGNAYLGWSGWDNGIDDQLTHSVTRPAGGAWQAPVAMTPVGSAGLSLAGMRDGALAVFEGVWGIQVRTYTPDAAPVAPSAPPQDVPSASPSPVAADAPAQRSVSNVSIRPLTLHVRVPGRGILRARLVRGRRAYASATRAVSRPGSTSLTFRGRIVPGRYTLRLSIRAHHRTVELRPKRVSVPR